MSGKALIVFARPPIAGQVKSRLTSLLTPKEAADVYRAFLFDSLKQYSNLNVSVRLYMTDIVHSNIPLNEAVIKQQVGDGLGQRMQHAFSETAAEGYHQIVIIGTDHPTLPVQYIQEAFNAVSKPPAISIGPTEDGGYYLLGMNPVINNFFEGIIYSQSDVYEKTLHRAYQSDAHVVQLPQWYDVDRPRDLNRLLRQEDILPEQTLKILRQLKVKYNLQAS
ncbi:MAG: TIGR04282 family arsenosugar biosynthesis glycosyltransferase [Bacteroidetes bacterium]|nr:TIGR04282 family arsenosugar biosynthesis glycosyltransferase [Bacteroidota bacterium]